MASDQAEKEYQAQIQQDLPRNFAVFLLLGLLGQTGFRLINTPTFVPAFILLLSGGSDIAVGLAMSLQALGSTLTPLLSANLIGHRQRVLPIGFLTGGSMRVAILGIALTGLYLEGELALYVAVACVALFGLFLGMQSVVFQVLLSKAIPVTNRGKLMGLRNFLAGITTAIVAWLAGNYLLGEPPTGRGYGWVFLLSFALTSAGLMLLALLREPIPPTVAQRQSLGSQLRGLPSFLRAEPEFRRYVVARAITTLGRMALPFYILYAGQRLGLSGEVLAVLTIAFTVAGTVSNLFWGLVADRYGFRACFLISVLLWVAATVLLLLSDGYSAAIVVFTAIGAAQEGFRSASLNMTLEFGDRERIALRLAVANSAAEAAGTAAPLAGGILASLLGYESVFLCAIACLLLGAGIMWRSVPEPRFSNQSIKAG